MDYKGLSAVSAKERLFINGPNELPSAKPKSVLDIFAHVVKEPVFIMIIASGLLYLILGNTLEGIVLFSSTTIIILINFYQNRKTENALYALRKLSAPNAIVIRDGKEITIPAREVVVDDIMILNEGNKIAADAMLLEADNLETDESMLTGESAPVIKSGPDVGTAMVYAGTMVTHGRAKVKVIAIGRETKFGQIAVSLEEIVTDRTRLQKEIQALIKKLFLIAIVLIVVIVTAFYFLRGNFLESLLNGLSAAMAIMPEEFPVVLTVFLALGALRLSRVNVLTNKPSAIETLGSATVLCTDKTGTLTQNKMQVKIVYDGNTIYEESNLIASVSAIRQLMLTARRASVNSSADAMEKAIFAKCSELITDVNSPNLIKEYPLSHDLFAMTRVTEDGLGKAISAKGAPETIFTLCRLTPELAVGHHNAAQALARKGYRVIGVAYADAAIDILPDKQQDFQFKFLGLIAFEDPIRPEVPGAVKECAEAGIKVIMMTGDYPVTASSIALQINLPEGKIITGTELEAMTDDMLERVIGNVSVFARVVPEQKLRIVRALQSRNEVVAMTGDGVNDAPALKAAEIGIAMGGMGTDVAREASALVLLDDNFASVVAAIRAGRRIYDNLEKAMSYIIAVHIPIIGLTLIPAFFSSLPLLLFPLHIVFLELIIDPACSLAFEYEKEEAGIMKRAPRRPEDQFFGGRKIVFGVVQGLLLLGMVLSVYLLSDSEGHTEAEVRAIAFSALIVSNIFLILAGLSKTRSAFSVLMQSNYILLLIIVGASSILLAAISVPALQRIFGFEFPGYGHFVPSLLGAFICLVLFEGMKFVRMRRSNRS